MKSKQELKQLFENGDKPAQEHFWEWMESYWHKDEEIPESTVGSIEKTIPYIVDNELIGSGISLNIPMNVTRIGTRSYSFSGEGSKIIELNLNEGLQDIGSYAFFNQSIKSIRTPSTLRVIENNAFNFQEDIGGQDSLEEIILNEGLVIIGDNAFEIAVSTSIKDLYIPDSVQSVGYNAFFIPSLLTVSAPSGLDLSTAGLPATAVITYR